MSNIILSCGRCFGEEKTGRGRLTRIFRGGFEGTRKKEGGEGAIATFNDLLTWLSFFFPWKLDLEVKGQYS